MESRIWDYLSAMGKYADDGSSSFHIAEGYLRAYLLGDLRFSNEQVKKKPWPAIGRHFNETLQDPVLENRITAADIVAVSFLSVDIPPQASWTVLNDLSDVLAWTLAKIPVDISIQDEACSYDFFDEKSDLQRLWSLLRTDPKGEKWGMGPTKVSKLLARKRPNLVPIQDSVVMRELQVSDAEYWKIWWEGVRYEVDGQRKVVDFVNGLKRKVPGAQKLSLLRVLDIVIWMHGNYGEKGSKETSQETEGVIHG